MSFTTPLKDYLSLVWVPASAVIAGLPPPLEQFPARGRGKRNTSKNANGEEARHRSVIITDCRIAALDKKESRPRLVGKLVAFPSSHAVTGKLEDESEKRKKRDLVPKSNSPVL